MADNLAYHAEDLASPLLDIKCALNWHRVVLLKRIPAQVPCRSGVDNKEKPSRRLGCQHWAINATASAVNPQAAAVRLQRLKEISPHLSQMKDGFETQEFFDLFSEYIDLTHCSGTHREKAKAKFGEWWRDHVAKSPQQVVVAEIQAPVPPDTSDGEVTLKTSTATAAADAVQLPSPPRTDDGVDSDAASEDDSVEDTAGMEQDDGHQDNMGLYSDITVVHVQEGLHQEQTQSRVEPLDTYEAPEACLAPVPDSSIDNINGKTSGATVNDNEGIFVANIEALTLSAGSTQPAEPHLNPEPSIHAPSICSRVSATFSELSGPGPNDTMSTCPDFDNVELDFEAPQLESCVKSNTDEAAAVSAQASNEATDNLVANKHEAVIDDVGLSSYQKGTGHEPDISVTNLSHVEETEDPSVDAVQQPAMEVSEVPIPQHEADQQPERPATDISIEQQVDDRQTDEQHQVDEQLYVDVAHTDELKANEDQIDSTQQLEQEADDGLYIRSSQPHQPAPAISDDQQNLPVIATAADEDHSGPSNLAANSLKTVAPRTKLSNHHVSNQSYVFGHDTCGDSTPNKFDPTGIVVQPQTRSQPMDHNRGGDIPRVATPPQQQLNPQAPILGTQIANPVTKVPSDAKTAAKAAAKAAVRSSQSGSNPRQPSSAGKSSGRTSFGRAYNFLRSGFKTSVR